MIYFSITYTFCFTILNPFQNLLSKTNNMLAIERDNLIKFLIEYETSCLYIFYFKILSIGTNGHKDHKR